ncbi:MAG: DUF2235 domain-containing protein [Pseudomonadota bacterium]|nr:DUF2235 domain-containing protein [Pseudomonadota bacterium]
MSNGRNLVLFLDGTWNTLGDNTNVWRMKSLCRNGGDQFVYYNAGVGTDYGSRLLGGMFGYGLDGEVLEAYQWLVENYLEGDRVFVFGFSRGAFTARSLSGFISKCGLLKPGSPLSLKQLFARYRLGATPHTIRGLAHVASSDLTLEDRWLKTYSMPIAIWFQGVFDTVGALGVPFGNFPRISRSKYSFLETDLRINYSRAYHALAIDEHRIAFAPTLWTKITTEGVNSYPPRSISDVEQRWFVGAHADVGGGYANGLLAQRPLQWLMSKGAEHGLSVKSNIDLDGEFKVGAIHDSFAEMGGGLYRAVKFNQRFFRGIGADSVVLGKQTTSVINETIDSTVFDRWRDDLSYRPRNLFEWARRRNVRVASLNGSLCADDPNVSVIEK